MTHWKKQLVVGFVFLIQAIVQTVFVAQDSKKDAWVPLTYVYPNGPPWNATTTFTVLKEAGPIPVMRLTLCFMWITAFFHSISAFVKEDENKTLRWIEYSITSTIMVLIISLMSGVTDLFAVIGIILANVAMILLGLVNRQILSARKEKAEEKNMPIFLIFWIGAWVGMIPWISIFVSVGRLADAQRLPPFVLAISVSLFMLFNCFGVLEFFFLLAKSGKTTDTILGCCTNDRMIENTESAYMFLSITAKSLLFWMVYAGLAM